MVKNFEKIRAYLNLSEFANRVVIELGLCLEQEKLSNRLNDLCNEILDTLEFTSHKPSKKPADNSPKKLMANADTLKVFRLAATATINDSKEILAFWESIKNDTIEVKRAKEINPEIARCLSGLMIAFNAIGNFAIVEARRMRKEPSTPKLISWMQMA